MSQIEGSTALDGNYGDLSSNPLTGGTGNNDLDKDAFLKLLIVQFQYQDPLNPMDDKEFIAQLAQFSALEQSMAINEKMDKVIISTDQQTTMAITNYIGKEVSARGLGISKKEGVISQVKYAATEPLSDCYVNMLDKDGQVVSTIQLGARSASVHEFNWDGKTSNGSDAPDGIYTAAFAGKGENGETVWVDVSISGRVTGTSRSNGEYWLILSDGRSVGLEDVYETIEAKPPKEVVPGITVTGTRDDDYLVGGEGADTILGREGNDIIVYDPIDELVDGGKGYDFLIATGDIGENAKNYEAIIRGANASDIKSMDDLADLGLVFNAEGTEIDTTAKTWTDNWTEQGDGQWTFSGNITGDKKVTITIMSQTDDYDDGTDPDDDVTKPDDDVTKPDPDKTAATRSMAGASRSPAPELATNGTTQSNPISFSEALRKGMQNSADTNIDNAANSLSKNATNTISRFMKAMNG